MPPSDPPDRAQDASAHPESTPVQPPPAVSAPSDAPSTDWVGIAAMPEFRALLSRKARFIIAGTIFFISYYFALPLLVGWFPELMERSVGPVNLAYVFALSQFVMAWVIAAIYVKTAAGWDRSAAEIIEKAEKH